MLKALAGVFLVLALVLGFQFTYGLHTELQDTRDKLASVRESAGSQVPVFQPFELAQADGQSVLLSDYCDDDVLLVYLYSDSARDEAAEAALADVVAQNSGKARVLSVNTSGAGASPPAELASLGDTADDANGQLMQVYGVSNLPSVVVLKNRPIYHATYAAASGTDVEQAVDTILAGDDLIPPPVSGCGGGCGTGGGCGGPPGAGAEGTGGGCAADAMHDSGAGDSCPATEMLEREAEST